jgi:plasmid stabilization system protein ParE
MAAAIWTPFAEAELDDILFYIAVKNRRPLTAERLYFEIHDLVERHAQKELPGHIHPDLPPSWRYIRHKRWLVAFEVAEGNLTVRRVVDASRDLQSQFDDEG